MRFFALIWVVFLSLNAFCHEGHQAFYRISEENGELMLIVKVELPDLKTCLNSEGLCNPSQEMNWCASTWISSLIKLKVNGSELEEVYESSYSEEGHLVVIFQLPKTSNTPETLEIENYCFLGSFDSYDNIFQVSIGDFNQGYRMSKNRTNIKIDLTDRS